MATVKVVELVSKAQTLLQDVTNVRWPVTELQGWLNDGYREVVNLRPDANTQTGTYTCTAGARQDVTSSFSGATRLVEVVRNTAATSDLRAVRLIDRRMLDEQRRTWYDETASVTVQHYMFDPRLPKEFLVYPPATTSAQLEIVYASVPSAHSLSESELLNASTAETINLDDSYANVLLDYMLYRAYSKDAEYAANAQRAVAHFQAMQNALGVSAQSNAASQPGVA